LACVHDGCEATTLASWNWNWKVHYYYIFGLCFVVFCCLSGLSVIWLPLCWNYSAVLCTIFLLELFVSSNWCTVMFVGSFIRSFCMLCIQILIMYVPIIF
jgi:hypothetical protein